MGLPKAAIREADPSWFLGENECEILWFKCLNKATKIVDGKTVLIHDHLMAVRVSETHPISCFNGDKYKNIWKMTREPNNILKIEPSIDASKSGCFHTGNPAYFQLTELDLDQLLDNI
ncbi:MAG: hypothetical protein Q8L88_02465 [Bacteroidota bacterium]|nr:hypothetical protein [Bacteroidota bacterium]